MKGFAAALVLLLSCAAVVTDAAGVADAAAEDAVPGDSGIFLGIAAGIGSDDRPEFPVYCPFCDFVLVSGFNVGAAGELGYYRNPWGSIISFDVSEKAARLRAMGSWVYPLESWKFSVAAGALDYVHDDARFISPSAELEIEWGNPTGSVFAGVGRDFHIRSGDKAFSADRLRAGFRLPGFQIAGKVSADFRIVLERQIVTLTSPSFADKGALEMAWVKFRFYYGL